MRCALCEATAPLYRQCSVKGCGLEIGYCKAHGGDGRAVAEMVAHIDAHAGAAKNATETTSAMELERAP